MTAAEQPLLDSTSCFHVLGVGHWGVEHGEQEKRNKEKEEPGLMSSIDTLSLQLHVERLFKNT